MLNIAIPDNMQELTPKITVIGVGGAGGNAVNNMIESNLEGVEFVVANTDGQALANSTAKRKIQLGINITQGLGAGSVPEIGKSAAEESIQDILSELNDSNMVFITAGLGGGTGTGAAPVIAKAAKEKGILTVSVVTKPFDFEGSHRKKIAEDGIQEIQKFSDTLIVIPNQNLFRLANERTGFAEAFGIADNVLHKGVCGVTDLMVKPGMINLDFADIKTVMGNMGKAMMGTGESSGENRAKNAAQAALNNPLLDNTNIKGAKSILLNIQGGPDMALFEVDEAASKIRNEVDENANIIFGSSIDNNLEGIIKVSVVATGMNKEEIDDYKNIFEDENISKDFNLNSAQENYDNNFESNFTKDTSELLESSNADQTDLETEINKLEFNQEKIEKKEEIYLEPETKKHELETLFINKPENKFTQSKPQSLFNRVSSFFGNNNNNEIKIEPSLNDGENFLQNKELSDVDINSEKVLQNPKSESDNLKKVDFDLDQNNKEIDDQSENFDLFNNKNKNSSINHEIDLTDIEQENKEVDEKVLEIPAFLRRQAN